MPGVIYRAIPRQIFTFDGLAANQTSLILGAKGLDKTRGVSADSPYDDSMLTSTTACSMAGGSFGPDVLRVSRRAAP